MKKHPIVWLGVAFLCGWWFGRPGNAARAQNQASKTMGEIQEASKEVTKK